MNCQRLYGWIRLENLVPPGRRSALEIGSAVHAGLAVFHGGGIDVEKIPLEARTPAEKEENDELREIAKQAPAEQARLLAQKRLRKGLLAGAAFEDMNVNEASDIVDRVLPAYFDYWADAGEIWKPLNQEIQFLVPVGDPEKNVWLRGTADNLSTAKGGLYLVDYKTAGRMDLRDLLKYELDTQLSAYIYGLTKELTRQSAEDGGQPIVIRGAIIDYLVKTKIPQFTREFFTRTDEELLEFEKEWVEVCSRIRKQEDRVFLNQEDWKIVFPKNTEHCFRYGTCAYRDLCAKDTEVRRKLYVKRDEDYVDVAQEEMMRGWSETV